MFHRPKTETQNETDNSASKPSPDSSAVSVVASNTDENTKTQTALNLKSQTGKDTTTMSTNQDNAEKGSEADKSVSIPQTATSSPFQRPTSTQTQTQAQGQAQTGTTPSTPASTKTYGTYNPSSYGSAPSAALGAGSGNDRRLVIGQGITMSGEIESCDHLLVEGSVEAALKGAKVLEISQTGKFYGTVEIEEATISGQFEGEINVSGRLTLAATGVVTGSIVYGELQVEAGATIDGTLSPMPASSTSKKGKGKEKSTSKKQGDELPLAS